MIGYLCPTCRQVAKLPNIARFAFCPSCGQALASFDRLPEGVDAREPDRSTAARNRRTEPASG